MRRPADGVLDEVDIPKLAATVEDFKLPVDEAAGIRSAGGVLTVGSRAEEVNRGIYARLAVMRRIADAFEPGLTQSFAPNQRRTGWTWANAREATPQLLGLLRAQAELDEMLGPQGPELYAARLHSWVWSAAESLWSDGHYRAAVQTAATAVDSHLQAKLGRYDTGGSDLVTQAFTLDVPTSGRPRLRFDRFTEGSPSYRDAHEGAMAFGRGCMMAIRNLVTHLTDELDEQVALEQLAALSVLARWIDEAERIDG